MAKKKIYFLFIGWKGATWFIDYAFQDALDIVSKTGTISRETMDKFSFMFYTDNRFFHAIHTNGVLNLQHNILQKDVDIVYDIFKKLFGNRFEWNKRNSKTINIGLKKL